MTSLFALIAAITAVNAQGLPQGRPDVASAGTAAEDGPMALWVNPANLAYDPDMRFAASYSGSSLLDARVGAFTIGTEGVQLGVRNLQFGDRSSWTLDYATGISLPERFAVGLLASWTIERGAPNYVAYDLGASWRPLPWLGLSGVAQNVGSADPTGLQPARSGAGIALLPFGRAVVIGVDAHRTFEDPAAAMPLLVPRDLARASLRLRPTEGLYLRGHLDVDLASADGPRMHEWGAGIEVFFGGVGGGFQQRLQGADGAYTGWVGTDEPGESLFRSRREVPVIALSDAPAYQPRASLLGPAPGPSWLDVMERVRRVEDARGVAAVVVRLDGVSLSWARWGELRQRILSLRETGRPVVAVLGGSPSNGAYWTATAATEILMHPAGTMQLTGLVSERTYLRGLFDLVGVEPEFAKEAEFKSAPESYTEKAPTSSSKEQDEALADDLFAVMVEGIGDRRGWSRDETMTRIDGGPWSAKEALELGLIDALAYPDELEAFLKERLNGDPKLSALLDRPQPRLPWEAPARVAVIYIEGAIVEGRSSGGGLLGGGPRTGADTVVAQLKAVQQDAKVKAVVLRVDSPGGSAFASDVIWRAITRLQARGIPVVVSMGGVAASGGYYVAASADAIWAEPNTITGSIGVFSGKFSTEQLFDGLGIGVSTVQRGANAGINSTSRPWTDSERERTQALVSATYDDFKARVRDGRKLTDEQVQEVARGRVWSGQRAQEVGLVDELGSLQDAIADARSRAGIPERQKVSLVTPARGGQLFASLAPTLLRATLGPIPEAIAAPLRAPAALTPLLPANLDASLLLITTPGVGIWAMDPAPIDPVTR